LSDLLFDLAILKKCPYCGSRVWSTLHCKRWMRRKDWIALTGGKFNTTAVVTFSCYNCKAWFGPFDDKNVEELTWLYYRGLEERLKERESKDREIGNASPQTEKA
jgi:hypothetical protein